MSIKSIALSVWASVTRVFHKDLDSLISTFAKLEADLDDLTLRGHDKLDQIVSSISALQTAQRQVNAELDRTYKVLHRISEITT